MKIRIHKLLCFPALIASLSLMLTGHATAQIFTTLYSFGTNAADGYHPNGLILSGNTLFGTTLQGGDGYPGAGMVFKINTDGSGFTNLYNFNPGSDGAYPVGSLVLSGNTLYGEANNGGNVAEDGILFSVNTDGSDHANLHFFNPGYGSAVDGGGPVAGLILSDNTLYGMTPYGGIDSNGGIVFKINTDGSSYTNYLHVFSSIAQNSSGFYTNSDGAQPQGALILSGNTLYGTTYIGGSSGNGTIFPSILTEPVLPIFILSRQLLGLLELTAMVPIHPPDCSYRAMHFMEQRRMVAVWVMAPCLRLIPMARTLQLCIALLTVTMQI